MKSENHKLRSELQQLIETTNDLQLQKRRLEKQYRTLLQEQQASHNMQLLRGSVFKAAESGSGFNFADT